MRAVFWSLDNSTSALGYIILSLSYKDYTLLAIIQASILGSKNEGLRCKVNR